jgi:hypothetical protein
MVSLEPQDYSITGPLVKEVLSNAILIKKPKGRQDVKHTAFIDNGT